MDSIFLFLKTDLGNLKANLLYWDWTSNCERCGKPTQAPRDLFCANFGAIRGRWLVCRRSWCAKCYLAGKDCHFHIARPENDEGLKWERSVDKDRFLKARPGDMLCASFQCDRCWFVNLNKREPRAESLVDALLMPYIRRVNLDILWSRETSTVYNNYLVSVKKKNVSRDLGLPVQFEPRGPWPVDDEQGFQTAVEMVRQSRLAGKNDKAYQQFDSIRKFRSANTNEFVSGVAAASELMLVGDGGRVFRLTSLPTQSRLFAKFMRGCEKRMGRLVKQNKALDVRILHKMLHFYELELLSEKTSVARKRFVKMAMAYFVISFVGALRH